MSAFIVSKSHIDRIVTTARCWRYSMPEGMTAAELGRMLWTENVKSVSYRYPDEPADLTEATQYRSAGQVPALKPVEALKAIECYAYQSCEHPTWEQSPAFAFVERFKAEAISRLPGYDEAPWAWSE